MTNLVPIYELSFIGMTYRLLQHWYCYIHKRVPYIVLYTNSFDQEKENAFTLPEITGSNEWGTDYIQ